jgi:hypothetical protein
MPTDDITDYADLMGAERPPPDTPSDYVVSL